MIAIDWKEPPAAVLLTATELVAAELKASPGRWARVAKDLKSKSAAKWKKLGLEVVAAPAESDAALWDIYARSAQGKPAPAAITRAAQAPKPPARKAEEDQAWAAHSEPGEVVGHCSKCTRKNVKVLADARTCRYCRTNSALSAQKVA